MKTIIVGGGVGCKAVLEMVIQNRLSVLSPEILGVVDVDPSAPGLIFAAEQGWPTFSDLKKALNSDGLELVIEVTGNDSVCADIARIVPDSVRIMDHMMARVFWDLDEMTQNLRVELDHKTKLEHEIREDRRRLQELLDSLPDSVMVVSEDGLVERVNKRFEEVTGISSKEVTGQPCKDYICKLGDDTAGLHDCPCRHVLGTGRSFKMVQKESCISRTTSQDERYFQTIANPIRDASGNFNVVITYRDVTEQIRLARETEEQAQRARQILNTVAGIITIIDLEGHLEFANPSAKRFYELEDDSFLGKTVADLLPRDVADIIEDNDSVMLAGEPHSSTEEVFALEGAKRILITERVLLYNYKNEPVGICRVSRNVTRARQMQGELVESEKHAAVGKLAAGVAHELNNPLTGILTFSEDLLEDAEEASPLYEDLEIIQKETLRCRRIVRDLLDFSRQSKADRQVISLEPVIRRTLNLVQKQAAFHDIDFKTDLNDMDLKVHADPSQLQQVFLNLVINARDAMDGNGTIDIRLIGVPEKRSVIFEIEDNGCGISQENITTVFEPFYTTKAEHGNGLGLAVVSSIVEEHGGHITAESAVEEWTIFRVSMPTVSQEDGVKRTISSAPAYHDWSDD
jgi:PAS domain S-box-containing protein